MIKSDSKENRTLIEGHTLTVLAEFSIMTHALIEAIEEGADRDLAVKMVTKAFELGRDNKND